jgi:5-methylcytosine-specific restriction endonuclease McrA
MGIHDKQLIYIIRKILTAPIKMPDGSIVYPTKGTPQGGIISPLLANIVLNELDHWVESQWENNPVKQKRKAQIDPGGGINYGSGYNLMRQTGLKEMHIVRYADDFRIFCRHLQDAERIKAAVTLWLQQRLKLEVSEEKTRIINVKKKYSEFLGFKIKVHKKKKRYVVMSHMCDKAFQKQRQKLVNQAKNIARPRDYYREEGEIRVYNSMVMGLHNYYRIATNINVDCSRLNRAVMIVLTNRLRTQNCNRLRKTGRPLTKVEQQLFGKSKMLRFVAGTNAPIYPVGYIHCKAPYGKKRVINRYSPEGRIGMHDNLQINTRLLRELMRQPLFGRSAEYADNRLSLFSAQWGKCGVTGTAFETIGDIHCHHILPRSKGGTDKYSNLILVLKSVHKLIHASAPETIAYYTKLLNLDNSQVRKVNHLREEAGLSSLTT